MINILEFKAAYLRLRESHPRIATHPRKPDNNKRKKEPLPVETTRWERVLTKLVQDHTMNGFVRHKRRWGEGWTTERVSHVATIGADNYTMRCLALMKATAVHMPNHTFALEGHAQFMMDVFIANPFTEKVLALWERFRRKPMEYPVYILEQTPGYGDVMASHGFRRQLESFMLHHQKHHTKPPKDKHEHIMHDFQLYAYERQDSFGDLGWDRPERTIERVFVLKTVCLADGTEVIVASAPSSLGGDVQLVHTDDMCRFECDAIQKIQENLHLIGDTGPPLVCRSKVLNKILAKLKQAVQNALAAKTFRSASADQLAYSAEVVPWLACQCTQYARPPKGAANIVANVGTAYMYMTAILRGMNWEKLRADKAASKKARMKHCEAMNGEERWQELSFANHQETLWFMVQRRDGSVTKHKRIMIIPRIPHDNMFAKKHKRYLELLVQVFMEDFRACAKSLATFLRNGRVHPLWQKVRAVANAISEGDDPGGHALLNRQAIVNAFTAMHQLASAEWTQFPWDNVFAARTVSIRSAAKSERVLAVFTYGTPDNAIKTFERDLRLDHDEPSWYEGSKTTPKIMALSGQDYIVQIPPELQARAIHRYKRQRGSSGGGSSSSSAPSAVVAHPIGSAPAENCCNRCQTPRCSGFFVIAENAYLCTYCVFKHHVGAFDCTNMNGPTERPNSIGIQYPQLAFEDRILLQRPHHPYKIILDRKPPVLSGCLYMHDKGTKIWEPVVFKARQSVAAFMPSRTVVGSTFKLPMSEQDLPHTAPNPQMQALIDPSTRQLRKPDRRCLIQDTNFARNEQVALGVWDLPTEFDIQVAHGGLPTREGAEAFANWLVVEKMVDKYKDVIARWDASTPTELDLSGLRRAWCIFAAERNVGGSLSDEAALAAHKAGIQALEGEHALLGSFFTCDEINAAEAAVEDDEDVLDL